MWIRDLLGLLSSAPKSSQGIASCRRFFEELGKSSYRRCARRTVLSASAMQLILLTAARRGEVTAAKWQDVKLPRWHLDVAGDQERPAACHPIIAAGERAYLRACTAGAAGPRGVGIRHQRRALLDRLGRRYGHLASGIGNRRAGRGMI